MGSFIKSVVTTFTCTFKFAFVIAIAGPLGSPMVQANSGEKELWAKGLKNRMEYLLEKSSVQKKHVSVLVSYSESHGERKNLVQWNSEAKKIPASLTKVITAAAVLDKFSLDHKFITRLQTSAPIVGDTLKGDVYLVGGGDPSFVDKDLWSLVNEFLRSGIRKIEGHIYIDDTFFDSVRYDSSRSKKRVDRAYDAPTGAMSFNWNSVNVFVRPGDKVGELAKVYADPDSEFIVVRNSAKTKKAGATQLKVSREKLENGKNQISVSGTIALGAKEYTSYKGVTDPALWTGYHLKAFLKRRGVDVTGTVQSKKAPSDVRNLVEYKSKPLSLILADMMKFSNNYVAEMLVKNLSVEQGSVPGNLEQGVEALKTYLIQQGVEKKDFNLVNPSGLTRDNLMRPVDLERVLLHAKSHFQIFPEFLSSLPISGVDGTLKRRLTDSVTKGWLRAKTGRLNGVIGLAGFAQSRRGPLFSYIFIYNGPASKMYEAQKLSDQLAFTLIGES